MNESAPASWPVRLFRSLGPAIIVASVVLGPGSMLIASRVGAEFGYTMVWALALASLLMVGMVALSARLGVRFERTLCEELAARLGRPVAMLIGGVLFLVVSCFQVGNNLGVLSAIEPFAGSGLIWQIAVLGALNLLIAVTMVKLRHLYPPVEKFLMGIVLFMLIGFTINLLFARPSLTATLAGLIPSLPRAPDQSFAVALLPVIGLIATTFSVAGAFYQSYLVREKGWTEKNLRQGLSDSVAGIGMLGLATLMMMVTSAAVLHGRVAPESLETAADVARQLEPLFGPWAKVLFCAGIFAGAFSSFLINAMIGGAMLSDGLGLGGRMDDRWPRRFTLACLFIGMSIAVTAKVTGLSSVRLIVFAQSLTAIGSPLLVLAMLYLATRRLADGRRAAPRWLIAFACFGLICSLLIAWRVAVRLLT